MAMELLLALEELRLLGAELTELLLGVEELDEAEDALDEAGGVVPPKE